MLNPALPCHATLISSSSPHHATNDRQQPLHPPAVATPPSPYLSPPVASFSSPIAHLSALISRATSCLRSCSRVAGYRAARAASACCRADKSAEDHPPRPGVMSTSSNDESLQQHTTTMSYCGKTQNLEWAKDTTRIEAQLKTPQQMNSERNACVLLQFTANSKI